MKNQDVFYDFYRKYFVTDAEPNGAHKAIAELAGVEGLTDAANSNDNVITVYLTFDKFNAAYN